MNVDHQTCRLLVNPGLVGPVSRLGQSQQMAVSPQVNDRCCTARKYSNATTHRRTPPHTNTRPTREAIR